ncbi:Longin-like domain [Pseudocohnilembus persalinus]|uniref:Longin-like domain n=1 Tax=Pseudocohnilembus persalinus TaxID=266149 RepID=A0A0V0QB57_PSEPJ|nr:Longin-like domain [Pseudocohnilembus persalinus]|eukprot:KRW99445.1 Longin-like domain [Pseudocohnilembus persalinus]
MSAQNIIAYLGIVDNKNNPVVLHNFEKNQNEELNFQMNVFCGLDIMEGKIKEALYQNSLLNRVYLSDDEYDVYGYQTLTKTKFILIIKQRNTLDTYDDTKVINVFKEIQKIYQQDLFNPFNYYKSGHYKPSQILFKNLDTKLQKQQEEFSRMQ